MTYLLILLAFCELHINLSFVLLLFLVKELYVTLVYAYAVVIENIYIQNHVFYSSPSNSINCTEYLIKWVLDTSLGYNSMLQIRVTRNLVYRMHMTRRLILILLAGKWSEYQILKQFTRGPFYSVVWLK